MNLKKLYLFLLLAYFYASPIAIHSGDSSSKHEKVSQPSSIPAPTQPTTPVTDHSTPIETTGSYQSAFIKMLASLVGLVLFVFLTVWLLRKMGQGKFMRGSGSIQIIEKRALSPKSVLYLVEVGHKRILITESHLDVRMLSTFDESVMHHHEED